MVSNNNWKKIYTRYRWMTSHPEFQKQPNQVLVRWLLWEVFKLIGYQPIINIHKRSKMQLQPGPKRGIHGLIYIFREGFEYTVRYAVEQYVSPGVICYDIGANMGFWTLRMSELVGNLGCVYAFEPMSKNIALFKQNILFSHCENNIQLIPVALGSKECISKIYIPLDPGSSSMAPESFQDQSEDIQVKCLDDIWEAQGFPNVTFVKIDVEGAEPLVLEGGVKFFQKARPVVACEINSRKLSAMGSKPDEIFDKFYDWKYDSFIFDGETNNLIKSELRKDGDVIFIPQN